MNQYIIRRLITLIPTVIIVAFLSFILMRLVPGDVILAQILSQSGGRGDLSDVDQELVAQVRRTLGLEGTVPEQFGRWISGVFRGDFGESWLTHKPTIQEFARRLPVTIELGIMAITLSMIIGISVGIVSALRQDKVVDYVGRVLAVLGLAIPNFWLGIMMILFLSIQFNYKFPVGQNSFFDDPLLNIRQFIIPAFVLAFASAGVTMRLTRTALLEVMRQDYIRTAYSKGLQERGVVLRHALKNALIPVITVIGTQITFIIAGSVVVEQIFNLRGVGLLTLSAIQQRDYVQVQTNVFIFSIVLVVGNLITDLAYGWLDPRIRYS